MFPPAFDYRRAGSVEEALDLLAALDGARPLAGGHSLLPALKTGRADGVGALVDLRGIDGLDGVTVDGDATVVGALTTYADLAADARLRERAPALADAADEVGDRQIRNRGTIGGNLAAADRGADLPAAVLAADARLRLRGPDGERTVAATDFFRGDGEVAVGEGELVTAVRLPGGSDGGAYVKKTHPASGYAMVGVAATVGTDGERVTAARVAATGATDPPTRLRPVEDALVGEPADEAAMERAAAEATAGLDAGTPVGDVHASGEFRAELLPTFAGRALTAALERAGGGPDDGDAAADGGTR